MIVQSYKAEQSDLVSEEGIACLPLQPGKEHMVKNPARGIVPLDLASLTLVYNSKPLHLWRTRGIYRCRGCGWERVRLSWVPCI